MQKTGLKLQALHAIFQKTGFMIVWNRIQSIQKTGGAEWSLIYESKIKDCEWI